MSSTSFDMTTAKRCVAAGASARRTGAQTRSYNSAADPRADAPTPPSPADSHCGEPLHVVCSNRCAYLSGVLSLVSTAILISDIAGFRSSNDMPDCPMNGDGPRRGGGFALNNTACQRERLAMAHSMRGYTIGFELTDALASFFIIPAVLTLGEVLGKGSSTRHLLVPPLVIVPIIRFFELSTMAGTEQVVTWMGTSEYFNLDGPGIEALIISAWVTRSAFMWLSSTDSLLMGVGLVTAGRMALREGKFHRCWAIISVLTGILGFLVFLLDMFRFTECVPHLSAAS